MDSGGYISGEACTGRLSVGAVLKIDPFGPYREPLLVVVVRVLALDVDVVVLHLQGCTEWRRISRGLIRRVISAYSFEVPTPIDRCGLL